MIVLLSPAKNLVDKQKTVFCNLQNTKPLFLKEAEELIDILKKKKATEIGKLMKLSEKLSDLNYKRYKTWNKSHTNKNSRHALLTFNGAVYLGLDAANFSEEELNFSQKHLRILSGLYGLLKPLDYFQDYRLEMGTKLKTKAGTNLYHFWDNKITNQLNKDLKKQGKVIVNLASNEYFKAVQAKNIDAKIITCNFKDKNKSGEYKTIMTYAKTARGLMAKFIVKNQITNAEDLKAFDLEGYYFSSELSTENELTFLRDKAIKN